MISDALRDELRQRNAEHETEYTMRLIEAQVFDLAAGIVPKAVQAMAITLLDWMDEDARQAAGREWQAQKRKARTRS